MTGNKVLVAALCTLAFSAPLHATPEFVTLIARDGARVQISIAAAQKSSLLREIIEQDADLQHGIHLPIRTGRELSLLKKCLEKEGWPTHMLQHLSSANTRPTIRRMYQQLLITLDEVIALLNNAGYLSTPSLSHECARCLVAVITKENCAHIDAAVDPAMHQLVAYRMLTHAPLFRGIAHYHPEPLRVPLPDHSYQTPRWAIHDRQATRWRSPNNENVIDARLSPDGRKVAVTLASHHMRIWERQVSGKWQKYQLPKPPEGTVPIKGQWSPDSSKLVVTQGSGVCIYKKGDEMPYELDESILLDYSPAHIRDVAWGSGTNTLALATRGPIAAHLYEYQYGEWNCTVQFGNNGSLDMHIWIDETDTLHLGRLNAPPDMRVFVHKWDLNTPERVAMRKKLFTIQQAFAILNRELHDGQ